MSGDVIKMATPLYPCRFALPLSLESSSALLALEWHATTLIASTALTLRLPDASMPPGHMSDHDASNSAAEAGGIASRV